MTSLPGRLEEALSGQYTIDRELGGGGMSRVFLARELALARPVVLKTLPRDLAAQVSAERFRFEIQVTAGLNHPNIVPVLSAGDADGVLYYTMPLVEGESLRALMSRSGALPASRAVPILRDVARALSHAHGKGIVHRDIKPDNILLTGHAAAVADFGIAKAVAAANAAAPVSLTQTGTSIGTPLYMAPEQAIADPQTDHRADLYALGAVAYEMLVGEPPFVGTTAHALLTSHLRDRPVPIAERVPDAPGALAELVMRCLEKDPARRPSSADEVLALLDAALTPVAEPGIRAWPRVSRRVVLGAVGLSVALAGAWWYGSRDGGIPVDPQRIILLPFSVTAPEGALDYLQQGIPELLVAEFNGDGGPVAVDPGTTLRAWRAAGARTLGLAEARAMARRLGAGQALLGSIVGSASRLTIRAVIVDAGRDSARMHNVTVSGSSDSLPTIVADLAGQLLSRGLGAWRLSAQDPGTASSEALRAFMRGRDLYTTGRMDQAGAAFRAALTLDSTFALAAYWLTVMVASESGHLGGLDGPQGQSFARAAWRHRSRLGPEPLSLLVAMVGDSGPVPGRSRLARHRAMEEAALSTNLPEAWVVAGESHFHFGALLGLADWAQRARSAFSRALSIDPTLQSGLQHISTLMALDHDTIALQRWLDEVSADAPEPAFSTEQYVLALLRGDREAVARARSRLADRGILPDQGNPAIPGPELDSIMAGLLARADTFTAPRRAGLACQAAWLAANRGQAERARALRLECVTDAEEADLETLRFAEDDSAAAFRLGVAPPSSEPAGWRVPCEVSLFRLRRGDSTGAGAAVRALPSWAAREAAVCARLIDALSSALQPPAPTRPLVVMDSIMRHKAWSAPAGDMNPHWNYDLALGFARHAAWPEAAAAARRRLFGRPIRLAVMLGAEGRYAALAGDTVRALPALRAFLRLRDDPDAAFRPAADSARVLLSRLEGARPAAGPR